MSTNDVMLAILSSDITWTSRIRRYWVKTLPGVAIMPNTFSLDIVLIT